MKKTAKRCIDDCTSDLKRSTPRGTRLKWNVSEVVYDLRFAMNESISNKK